MSYDDLKHMPKVELHCHLELAFRKATLRGWALEKGMAVAREEDFDREFLIKEPMDDLPTVLHKFLNTRDVIDTEAKVEQLTFEACEDMFLLSNVRILELRYAPSFLLDAHPSMDADRMLEAILRGMARRGRVPHGCGAHRPASTHQICGRQRLLVRLDLGTQGALCGHGPPATPFAPLFQKAKAQGLASPSTLASPTCLVRRRTSWSPSMNWGRTASDMGSKHSRRRVVARWPKTALELLEQRAHPGCARFEIPPVQAVDGRWGEDHSEHRRPRGDGHLPESRMRASDLAWRTSANATNGPVRRLSFQNIGLFQKGLINFPGAPR